MTLIPGLGGTLLPARFLADALDLDGTSAADLERHRQHLVRWWDMVMSECGPATGLRAIFDLVAMPLFGRLGFRAHDAIFERGFSRAWLSAPDRTPVGLLILSWAAHAPARWRHAAEIAADVGAQWCFVLAPPHLILVDARAQAIHRSLDVVLPAALDPRSFARTWRLLHAAAFTGLDRVVEAGARFQDRVRDDLQSGVVAALSNLHRVVPRRRPDLATAPFDEALTIVYRVLFLLFAESRDLVPRQHPIYRHAYALGPMCHAAAGAGDARGLWEGLAAITRLSRRGGRSDDLIVKPFNGRLFARDAAPSLEVRRAVRRATSTTDRRDRALQQALLALGSRPARGGRQEIHYADLGVEQLGAVYERVLDLEPDPPATPSRRRAGHSQRRKHTGTFYTPQSLAAFVVRRTLAPLTAGATSDAILSLRIVDPAMGSGAFLIAACRFLAAEYERALIDEGRLTADDVTDDARADMRRIVAERCLAGVDANPVAVQVARLSLWLATLARGKPLSFLDHKLRVGNSLIGASPGDLRRAPQRVRPSSAGLPLFDEDDFETTVASVSAPLHELLIRRDDTITDVRAKEVLWRRLAADRSPLGRWRLAASVWCARWFAGEPRASAAESRAAIDAILHDDRTLRLPDLSRIIAAARQTASAHRFFHWPLEFPDVFTAAPERRGGVGFDAVIGNPPWEVLRRDPGDDQARMNATDFLRFVRDSGIYRHCDRGHLNLYQPFVERSIALTRPGGRVGLVLPWGLASDDGASVLRELLLGRAGVDTIVGLDNRAAMFPIHRGLRFLTIVATPGVPASTIRARFGVTTAAELDRLPAREDGTRETAYPIRLSPARLQWLGGRAGRWPDLRERRDAELLDSLLRRFPALGDEAGWAGRFGRELNVTEDRRHFGHAGLPVLEGKHVSAFAVSADTRWRLTPDRAARLLPDRAFDRPRVGYRDVSGVGNQRSLIAAVIPRGCVTTHTIFCLRTEVEPAAHQFLSALLNSFVLNFVARLLMGGHMTTSLVESLPAPRWTSSPEQRRLARLAERQSRRPSPPIAIALEVRVARMFGIDADSFRHIVSTFPLISADTREQTITAYSTEPRPRRRDARRSAARPTASGDYRR
ncbi:MAG TPA: N-6 DNA methylase [Vicinamibacterales bacterium]|nr:N-6 DNA methylase [Vicinamibacterales bacterium]